MLNGELFRVAWRAISAHKLRSFLTLLGVIIGVMTVVAVVSVIQGLNNYVATKLFTLSPDVYTIERFGIITSRDEFLEALKRKRIQKSDFEAFQRLSRTAVMVGARSGTSRSVRSGSKRLSDVQISGVTANIAELSNLDVDLGRFFTEPENERRAFVAVIGTEVRDELFPRLDPVGRTISIDGIPFRVIGLLVKQGSAFGQSQDNVVYVPREALAKAWGTRRNISIYVKARGGVEGIPASMDEARVIFRALRKTAPSAPDPVSFVTAEAIQVVWRSISAGAFALLVFISGISLVVGAIVIANIMLVSVVETDEGDRHPPRDRGEEARHPPAVPPRGGAPLPRRRRRRRPLRVDHLFPHQRLHAPPHARHAGPDHDRPPPRHAHRPPRRRLPGGQGVAPPADRGPSL